MNKANKQPVKLKQPKSTTTTTKQFKKPQNKTIIKRHLSKKSTSKRPLTTQHVNNTTMSTPATATMSKQTNLVSPLPLQRLFNNNLQKNQLYDISKVFLHTKHSHIDPKMNKTMGNNQQQQSTTSQQHEKTTNDNNINTTTGSTNGSTNGKNWHSTTRTISSSYRFSNDGTNADGVFQIVSGQSIDNNPMKYTVKRGELKYDKEKGRIRPNLVENFTTTDIRQLNQALPSSSSAEHTATDNTQRQLGSSPTGDLVSGSPTLASASSSLADGEQNLSDVNTVRLRASRSDAVPPSIASSGDFDPVKEMESLIASHNRLWNANFKELHRKTHHDDFYKHIWE